MSESAATLDENSVHYVYGDQEYVMDAADSNSGIICSDGSRAILVNGQYYLTDTPAILLQGDTDLTQYYLNDNSGEILKESYVVNTEDVSVNNLFEGTEIVQLVEEETNDGQQQIIYYTNEDANAEDYTVAQEIAESEPVEGIQDEEGKFYPFKRIKLEGQMLDFDEFVQQQQENTLCSQEGESGNEVQYALMEDGNYQLCTFNPVSDESSNLDYAEVVEMDDPQNSVMETQIVDLSKITGRNLITGQTVTLHSYMEKLKKKLKGHNIPNLYRKTGSKKLYPDQTRTHRLTDLIDKKIAIGKTRSGKRIVGKIIHVERKGKGKSGKTGTADDVEREEDDLVVTEPVVESTDTESAEKSTPEPDANEAEVGEPSRTEERTKILVRKCSVSKDSFEQISKTLGGVMEMDSVCKKLQNKNIVVKLVEKKYAGDAETFTRNTSYSYGYMEKETCQGGDGETVDRWKFVPDQNTQDALIGDRDRVDDDGEDDIPKLLQKKTTKFPITTSITILISHTKGNSKTIRVNLNPAPGNLCTICAQYFKNVLQLRQHMNRDHNADGSSNVCEVCGNNYEDPETLQEHRNLHVQEGKLFICSECNKCFTSQGRLHKHLPVHDLYLRPLECSVCEVRCASEWALKKHLLTHTGIKPFACDVCHKQFLSQYDVNFHRRIHFPEKHFACNVCLRTFSRHSNLLRHMEIHKGTGALYKCNICYCSYNYVSSLTRHMVQNHIDANDVKKRVEKSSA